jgi:hypothetical protein
LKRFLSAVLIYLISYSLFISCGNKKPILEDAFIKIYSDMTVMQDTSMLPQKQIREKILSKYHYLETDYNKMIYYYNSNPNEWTKYFDKVIVYVENLKSKTTKSAPLVLPKRYVLKDM